MGSAPLDEHTPLGLCIHPQGHLVPFILSSSDPLAGAQRSEGLRGVHGFGHWLEARALMMRM